MRHWPLAFTILSLGLMALPAGGCEVSTVGDLAVTWRFNGHASEQGDDPCGALGAHRIVIELDGPETVADVVACSAMSSEYPLGFLSSGSTTWAYGHLSKDLREGSYDVRVFFIDADGQELAEPDPWQGSVTIEREKVSRVDLDFSVTTGRLEATWEIGGGAATCDQVDAATIALTVREAGGAEVDSVEIPCDGDDYSLLGVAPGDYTVGGQLLDAGGTPLTVALTSDTITVSTADVSSTSLDFGWSDFTVPILGNARLELTVVNSITTCSAVDNLAQGPLSTRMLLSDSQGAPVPTAQAFANPDAQLDCDGLAGGHTLDGTTLGPCHDVEQIICDLQVGDYTLSVAAHDASDLECYAADLALSVRLDTGDPQGLRLQATADATDCWL